MSAVRRPLPRRLLLAFALSGISALVYEIIWVRLLGDLFGHTAYAIQVVLAVFFGGLAAGSFLSDRINLNKYNPIKIYAAVEVSVGAIGILFPYLISLITPLYDVYAPLTLEGVGALISRLAVASVLLLIPTALLGATLPLVIRWRSECWVGDSGAATLYAVNTLGGAVGTWLCAFVFIKTLGISNTLLLAAAGNFLAASLTLSLRRAETSVIQSETDLLIEDDRQKNILLTDEANRGRRDFLIDTRIILPILLFTTGFIAITLEVLWSRALDQVLSGSVYSFATVLTVFLTGIAAGSWAYRRYLTSFSPLLVFVILEIVLANYIVASLFMIRSVADIQEKLLAIVGTGFFQRGIALESILSAVILLIPTICMGILFPLLVNFDGSLKSSVKPGLLVAANTLGSVVAPLFIGFFLLPHAGLLNCLLLAAGLCAALVIAVTTLAPINSKPLLISCAMLPMVLLVFAPRDIRTWGKPGERLVDYREDPAASVSVVEYGERTIEKKLKVNNTYSLGGGRGVFTERRQGHLPMLLHPSPSRVLVLGVGTGNTLGAISLHRPDELVAVDLIAGVLDLAKKDFGDTNYRVLEDDHVRVINADALRVVRASPHKYDVIIADLFHPWQAGVGSLYSREHFEAARGALSQGGIFCQWLPLYQLSGENLKTIIRTFISVYPETSAWLGNFGSQTPALALVGSESPVHFYWKRWEESLSDAELRAGMSNVYLDRAAEIVGGYIAARGELESFAGDGPINRTDRPTIEFSAPETLFSEDFEASKRDSLESLIHINRQPQLPVSFEGARVAASEEYLNSNVMAVRWMIQSFLNSERGDRSGALKAAMQSCQTARGYEIPSAVLAEMAWSIYQENPAAAEQAFKQALLLRPDDANVLTGLGATYLFQRRADSAIEAFERALKSRPGWAEAVEGLEKAKRLKDG